MKSKMPSSPGGSAAAGDVAEVELGNVRDTCPLVHASDFAGNGFSDGNTLGQVSSARGAQEMSIKLRQWYDRWRANAVIFWASIGGVVTVVLLLTLLSQWNGEPTPPFSRNCKQPGGFIGDTVAPEGSIGGNFEARYDYRGRPRWLSAASGMVTADHGRCSDIGSSVLLDGGNAVDAAVAVALCQGVMNPMASGLGGGHFMLIRLPNGTAEMIDAREVAPSAANETMFQESRLLSLEGGLAVGVPLELRGLALAHSRHGTMPWSRLVEPSIEPAERGFPAHPYLVAALEVQNFTRWVNEFPLLRDTFFILDTNGWRLPKVNETCCARPSLAKLLREVADSGAEVLYSGEHASQLVKEIAAAGGIITVEDLMSAQPVVREPLRAHAMGVDLIAAPPPSSAAAVLAALKILAGYDLPLAGSGSLGVHRLVESMKHVFALRTHLGDPGPPNGGPAEQFLNLTTVLKDVLSDAFADELRVAINDSTVLNVTEYGGKWGLDVGGVPPEDHGTTHFNVVCPARMAVSFTSTVNGGFGSKVFSKSTGLVLNNQMDDFSTPNRTNVYGLQPSPSNYIRPGKRPLSSMSPIIVEQAGQIRVVVGGSGGPRIISAVLQTLVRYLAYGEDLLSSVGNPRLHHQLLPDTLYAEDWSMYNYSQPTLQALISRGHSVQSTAWGGVSQAIAAGFDDNKLLGVSDPRKDGAPAGF